MEPSKLEQPIASSQGRGKLGWRAWLVVIAAAVALTLYGYYSWTLSWPVPEKLEITGLVRSEQHAIIGSCGGAIFRLSERAANAIENDGVKWLADSREARSAGRWQRPRIYEPWKATPVPKNWDSPWVCMSGEESQEIERAMNNPGSFYTGGGDVVLIVVPKLHRVAWASLR